MGPLSADEALHNHVPAVFGGDLPKDEQDAYQAGHDADLGRDAGTVDREDDAANDDSDKIDHDDCKSPSSHVSLTGVPSGDIEKVAASSETEVQPDEPRDPNVVDWDGPDDPEKPVNWPSRKKWAMISILSFMTFLTPLASSMFAPAVPKLLDEFGVHNDLLATWVVSVYILGFAAGPIVIAPLSEMFGRVVVYNVCNVIFLAFTIACALAQNMNQLIVFRFFAGTFGIAPISNGGGSIADLMRAEERGVAMSIWSVGPLLGPVIGPVCGGFLAQAEGWRWIFWVLAVAGAGATLLCFVFMRETYGPTLLERKTRRLIKQTGNDQLRSALDLGITPKQFWTRSLLRPLKLMTMSLICASMSLMLAVVYGIMYLLYTTFSFVFEDRYDFSTSVVGLVFIGLGTGMLLGLAVTGATSDRLMKRLADKHSGGKLKPEYRLPIMIVGAPFIPAGLFIYGWTAQARAPWIAPILGTAVVGVGLLTCFMAITMYLVDAFALYAASAVAASTVARSVLGAVFPLFGLALNDALGLGWANTLLGAIALVLCAVPVLFYRYGERIRTHPRLQVEL